MLKYAAISSPSLGVLAQGACCLAVGEPQSMFTLYQPALDAGLRPSHFDPGDELLGAEEAQVLQALEQTCAAGAEGGGACVLVRAAAGGALPMQRGS